METHNLFKYKKFDEHTLENLSNDKIWYCNPEFFNDIFDTYYFLEKVRLDLSYIKLKELLSNNNIDTYTFETLCVFLGDSVGILSLTDNCCSNPMWAHYSDYHKGFCMEFEFQETDEDCILQATSSNIDAHKVDYRDTYKIPKSFEERNLHSLFLQKSKEWSYENEYRVIISLEARTNFKVMLNKSIEMTKSNENLHGIHIILNKILKLLDNNFYEYIFLRIKMYLDEININIVDDELKSLINKMKKEIEIKGRMNDYPSKLVSIIFGYDMNLDTKKEIRDSLSHLPEIKYKKIVRNNIDYKLKAVEESFSRII